MILLGGSRRTELTQGQAAMTPTPRLAITTLVASLGYLGLAVLGFGGLPRSSLIRP
jgi:hypothetical protein